MKIMACNKSRWKVANQSKDWKKRRRRRRIRIRMYIDNSISEAITH
jgi:hypothetical protein